MSMSLKIKIRYLSVLREDDMCQNPKEVIPNAKNSKETDDNDK